MDNDACEGLDIGIRAAVLLLNSAGLLTTDSGDGFSKFADPANPPSEEVMAVPHIAIRADPGIGAETVGKVKQILTSVRLNYYTGTQLVADESASRDPRGFSITGSWSPGEPYIVWVSGPGLIWFGGHTRPGGTDDPVT